MAPLRRTRVLNVTIFRPQTGESHVSDLIYIVSGVVALLAFAGYAALLRRV